MVSWYRFESCNLRSTADTWLSTVFTEILSSTAISYVGIAACDEAENLSFARCQLVELRVERRQACGLGAFLSEGIENKTRQMSRKHGAAARHSTDRLDQLWPRDVLRHVATCASPDHGDDVLGRVGDREGEEPHAGAVLHYALQHGLAATAGHMVYENQFGSQQFFEGVGTSTSGHNSASPQLDLTAEAGIGQVQLYRATSVSS